MPLEMKKLGFDGLIFCGFEFVDSELSKIISPGAMSNVHGQDLPPRSAYPQIQIKVRAID